MSFLKKNPLILKLTRWFALIGLFCGVLYSFGGAVYDLSNGGWNSGTILAFGALLGMPALFALAGLLFGLLIVLIRKLLHC
ncbi:MAG: hypothetical protein Kow0037_24750 [Calditrichia bacterium]